MFSIIIPSYNSEQTIAKCLDSIRAQAYAGEYEIILVDSSVDATPDIVTSSYPEVTFIHLDKKTDPGTARNIGIARSCGDIVAFLDSDCIASVDWLCRIESAHDSSYKAIGGSVLNGNDKTCLVAWAGYIAEFREFIPEQAKREVSHIPTCNISYKRVVFEEYGLFQGEYYPQEDLVFNHKLSEHGEKILFDPSIQVHHHHRTECKDFLRHQRRIGEVTSRVMKKVGQAGSFIPRHPFATAVLLPLLPLLKFVRTLYVFMKLQPHTIIRHPQVVPVFAVGLVYWGIGFSQGVFARAIK